MKVQEWAHVRTRTVTEQEEAEGVQTYIVHNPHSASMKG